MNSIGYKVLHAMESGVIATGLTFALIGCGTVAADATSTDEQKAPATQSQTSTDTTADQTDTNKASAQKSTSASNAQEAVTAVDGLTTDGVIDTSNLFSERDLTQTVDTSTATQLKLENGKDVTIDAEGIYVASGEATNARIIVNAEDTAKVQIVLDGATITNESAPAIYVKSADKVWVTTTKGSSNALTVSGEFAADGDTNCDAVIFSTADLVLNGQGTLQVNSSNNGITSKDELTVTGGSYEIAAAADGLEAHDSIAIADGSFAITSEKDGLHAEYDEDDSVGFVYVCGGTFDIAAKSDAIQATTYLQVDNGTLNIDSAEGLEATYVQINGGKTAIKASDDGVNATTKSSSIGTPTIEIRGGELTVDMGQGDTDALDANGNLSISGGTVTINAQSAFDFDGQGSLTGGTVTVNGEQISELTNSMQMGGGHMGGGRMNGGQMGEGQMGAPTEEGFTGGPRGNRQQVSNT